MKCPICGKKYKTNKWLMKHIANNHPNSGLTLCHECGKIVPNSNGCQYCGAWLGKESILDEANE